MGVSTIMRSLGIDRFAKSNNAPAVEIYWAQGGKPIIGQKSVTTLTGQEVEILVRVDLSKLGNGASVEVCVECNGKRSSRQKLTIENGRALTKWTVTAFGGGKSDDVYRAEVNAGGATSQTEIPLFISSGKTTKQVVINNPGVQAWQGRDGGDF